MTADFRSECKLSELMMEMPCGFALFQSTGEVSYSNSRAREILGVLPGENHGGSLTNHHRQVIDISGSVLSQGKDPLALAVNTKKPVVNRLLGIRDPSGEVNWVSLCATPHLDDSDNLLAVSVAFSTIAITEVEELTAYAKAEFASPLHRHAKMGLWAWNFRTGEFCHDRNFSRVTRTEGIVSIGDWSRSVAEADRQKFVLQFDLLRSGIPEVEFAYKSHRGNGSQHLCFVRASAAKASPSYEARIEGSVIDITTLLPGTLEVGELVDSMSDGYISLDRNWCISSMNKQAERLLNLSHTDTVGTSLWDQFPSALGTKIFGQLKLAMAGKHVSFDFVSRGSHAWLEIRAHPLPNGIAIYFRDITEQHNMAEERERLLSVSEKAKERLLYAASHDALTNLPNRSALLSWIDSSLTVLPPLQRLAVLFIDLDHFKRVNDTHGHAEGDRVLIQISNSLTQLVGKNSMVARLGGDEFVVVLLVDSVTEALHAATGVLREFSKPVMVNERSLVVTPSIGVSISDESSTAETLLRDADVALYAAKEQGRNRVRLFDNAIRQQVVTRLDTEADLRDALRLDQISVHFQPIFSISNKELAGFETLTRWFHRDKGSIPPEIFISVAEESGLILPLGEHLIDSTLQLLPLLSKNANDADGFTAWINVSSRQLEDYGFVNHLIDNYRKSGRPGQLGIQLTESVLAKNSPETHSVLHSLAGKGVRIAIDDFGKGYSSLSRLAHYPLDLIVLDRSMVDDILSTSGSAMVQALINLSHAINAQVCASGIESEQQLRRLIDLGVDLASGYYLGQPQPIEQISESIKLGRDGLAKLDS